MFQPILPSTGLTGWYFLQRTADAQKETLAESGVVSRQSDYFRENIGSVSTAADLVADRTLLNVALGAFGLEADIDNKFFVQKILEEGTQNSSSLANQLSDKRYLAFANAMGFATGTTTIGTRTQDVSAIVEGFQELSFETAVGDQDPNLRLALSVERELGTIATRSSTNDTKWFTIMGTPPLRKIFEGAFGLSSGFANLPIDKQLETFKDRAESRFGTSDVSDFLDPKIREDLTRLFLLREQISSTGILTGNSIALTLLQS